MDIERLFYVTSSLSLGVGSLLAAGTIVAVVMLNLDPQMPQQIVTVLFVASLIFLAFGCHWLDCREHRDKTR